MVTLRAEAFDTGLVGASFGKGLAVAFSTGSVGALGMGLVVAFGMGLEVAFGMGSVGAFGTGSGMAPFGMDSMTSGKAAAS